MRKNVSLKYLDLLIKKSEKLSSEFEQTFPGQISNYRKDVEVYRTLKKYVLFKDYFNDLYGKGLEVANWHLNGKLEPFDTFFESACEYAEKEV